MNYGDLERTNQGHMTKYNSLHIRTSVWFINTINDVPV